MIRPHGTLANLGVGGLIGTALGLATGSVLTGLTTGLALAVAVALLWVVMDASQPSVQRILAKHKAHDLRKRPHPSGLTQEAYQRVERVVYEVMGRATRFDFDVGPDEVDLWIYPEWRLEVHEGPYWWHEAHKQLQVVLHRLRGVSVDWKLSLGGESGYRLRSIDPWQPPGKTAYTLGLPPDQRKLEDIVRRHVGEGASWNMEKRPNGVYDLKIYSGKGLQRLGDKTRLRKQDTQTYVPLMKALGGTRWTRGVYDVRTYDPKTMHIIENIRI